MPTSPSSCRKEDCSESRCFVTKTFLEGTIFNRASSIFGICYIGLKRIQSALPYQIGNLSKDSGKRGVNMKATVNEECIGCGLCEGTCPDVFSISVDGYSVPIDKDIPEDAMDAAQEAANNCPASAITIE